MTVSRILRKGLYTACQYAKSAGMFASMTALAGPGRHAIPQLYELPLFAVIIVPEFCDDKGDPDKRIEPDK